jgi:hypothetical protein
MVDEFNFQGMKKYFRDGVAPAITFMTRFVGCLVFVLFSVATSVLL